MGITNSMDDATLTRLAVEYYDENVATFEAKLDAMATRWGEHADLVRAFATGWILEGYMKLDVDRLVSWVTDDIVHEDPLNLGRAVHGRQAFRQMLVDSFRAFPDTTFTATDPMLVSLDGATIAVPWRGIGHFTGPLAWGEPGSRREFAPTGRRFDFTGCDFYTFRDGKVAVMKSLYDPVEVAEQLGLLPARTGLALRAAPWLQGAAAFVQRRMT